MTEATIAAPAPAAAPTSAPARLLLLLLPLLPSAVAVGSNLYRSTQASFLFAKTMPRRCSKRSWARSRSLDRSASEEQPVAADEPVAVVEPQLRQRLRLRMTRLSRRLKTPPEEEDFQLELEAIVTP